MKKNIIFILLCLFCLTVFIGCSNNQNNTDMNNIVSTEKQSSYIGINGNEFYGEITNVTDTYVTVKNKDGIKKFKYNHLDMDKALYKHLTIGMTVSVFYEEGDIATKILFWENN